MEIKPYIKSTIPVNPAQTNPINFPKLNNEGNVTDFEGNVYKTVKIGNQTWMAENLRSTKYSDGKIIENAHAYDDDSTFVPVYGRLYDWETAMNGQSIAGAQGVCPSGWHVPTEADWATLINYAGGNAIAGKNLKEIGNSHWTTLNDSTHNKFGFTGLPAGRYPTDSDANLHVYDSGSFWSSTAINAQAAWGYTLIYDSTMYQKRDAISKWQDAKFQGFSVRCIKN